MAFPYAVEACHTTGIVNCMGLAVDAGRFAVTGAKSATVAFRRVNYRAEERIARENAQYASHGADGIAIRAAVSPSQYGKCHEGHYGHCKGDTPFKPDVYGVESITVMRLSPSGQKIVDPHPCRT